MSPPDENPLTLDAALDTLDSRAVVVFEALRRWLELRPGLQLTFTSHHSSSGEVLASAAVSWDFLKAPSKMSGTWASMQSHDRADWPLYRALTTAARAFEAAERKGTST